MTYKPHVYLNELSIVWNFNIVNPDKSIQNSFEVQHSASNIKELLKGTNFA